MKGDGLSIRLKGILGALMVYLIFSAGCLQIPSFSKEMTDIPQEHVQTPYNQSEDNQTSIQISTHMPSDIPAKEETPLPTPPPFISNISDWNPYNVLPTPEPALNHSSILKNDIPNVRKVLNTTHSGSVGLAGNAYGKDLNITTGPFSITYTVHPNISSPLDVWVKLTVLDPWHNVVAVGGYNRRYPNQETQTMVLYREGRYYLTIEGDFASVDYLIKTGDLAPVSIQTQTSVSHEEIFPEEMIQ